MNQLNNLPFNLITLTFLITPLTQGATLSWSGEAGTNFTERDAVRLDGTVEANSSGSIGNITPANSPTTLSDGLTRLDITYSGSVGSVDNPNVSGSVFTGDSAGFRTFVVAETVPTSAWGGSLGGVGQPSAFVIQTQGGQISQTDSTLNQLGIFIDFSNHSGGGVSSVNFDLAGINNRDLSVGGGGTLNNDVVTLRAFDAAGSPITLDSGFFNIPASATYAAAGLGSNSLTLTPNNAGPIDDHIDPNTNLGVDFGNNVISRIEIDYDPTVTGIGSSSSTGFAIGDITFVPEPSSSLLFALSFYSLLLRRQR